MDTVDFALLEYTEKDHEKDIDSYLDTAVQADKFGCGSRLITYRIFTIAFYITMSICIQADL